MNPDSAMTAVVFEQASDGSLNISAVMLRRGGNEARLKKVAHDTLELLAKAMGDEDRERLNKHMPPEFEA